MHNQPARQTFGQRNTKSVSNNAPRPAVRASKSKDIKIHPMILAGGSAFVLIVGAVLMLGGPQPVAPVPGRAPQITELPAGSQPSPQQPARPAPQPAPASGGKFGAATSAFQNNR